MKIVYTILFFADTLLLIVLTYAFFKLMDSSIDRFVLAMMVIAIAICIFMLIHFLNQYIKIPSSENKEEV
ncbi:MAG TPA: hypothetical protein VIJ92_03120 [Ginsengibacter sp.]